MSVIKEISLTEPRMVLWQNQIISLVLFLQIVEVTYHQRVRLVIVRVLMPDVAEVSRDFNWLHVEISIVRLCSLITCHEKQLREEFAKELLNHDFRSFSISIRPYPNIIFLLLFD